MKKHLIRILIFALLLTVVCIPAFAADEETNPVLFTRIDLHHLTYGNGGTDAWSIGNDNILSQTAPKGTKFGDCVAMSDISLEKGKAYTLEVKVRFTEPFSAQSTDSRAIGLVFGGNQINPWGTGGAAYCAMIDRATGSGKHIRVFTRNITSSVQDSIGRAMTADELTSTEWQTIRVTITEAGVMTCYLDGVLVGTSDESASWNGGLIGVNTYGVRTKVEIKDFAYASGVVTGETVYADDVAEKYPVTVHYVYKANGEKAAEDIVLPVAKGQAWTLVSPDVENCVPDQASLSGIGTGAAVELTVTYARGYTLTIHYVRANGEKVYDDYVQTRILPGTEYSVSTVPISNHQADQAVVSGVMGQEDLEVTVTFALKKYKLTVSFVDENGNTVHEPVVSELEYGSSYNVQVPEISGMSPNVNEVAGKALTKDTTVRYNIFRKNKKEPKRYRHAHKTLVE